MFGQGHFIISIQPDSIFIGLPVELNIAANLEETYYPRFSDLLSESDNMKIEKIDLTGNEVSYTLTFWELGKIIIPSIPVQIMQNNIEMDIIGTDEITINILSILNSRSKDIKEIKRLRDIEFTNLRLRILFLGLIIFSFAILFYLMRKRKLKIFKVEKWVPPPKKPYIYAINKLKKLIPPYPITSISVENYYIKISSILRNYLGSEYYFKATEMTTSEIYDYFIDIEIFDNNLSLKIESILSKADMSKYAQFIPEKTEFSADSIKCINLIREIESTRIEIPSKLTVQ